MFYRLDSRENCVFSFFGLKSLLQIVTFIVNLNVESEYKANINCGNVLLDLDQNERC